jgi:predicted porin
MKKALLAAAVAAAVPALAQAQTNVVMTGNFKTGIAQSKYSNGASNNGNHTAMIDGSSRFIIRGTEDLGGGLKAIFQMENRFRPDNGGTQSLAGGNTFVGLTGGFGSVRLGKLDLYWNQGIDTFQNYATAHQASNVGLLGYVGSNSNPIARTSRSSNVVRYDLPKLGGLKGGAAWSPGATGSEGTAMGDGNKGNAWQLDLAWSGGPFTVGGAYWDEKLDGYKAAAAGANTGQQAWRLYGTYKFAMLTVGLTYDEAELTYSGGGDRKRGAWSIPVTAKAGPGTFVFAYTQAQDMKVGGSKRNDTGARMFAVGYDYPLSKRTSLGVSYAVINNDSNASYGLFSRSAADLDAPVAGQDTRQFYVGVRHAF